MPVPVQVSDPNVIYPTIESYVKVGEDAVTADQMKEWLGWEDEDTYKQRMGAKGDKKKSAVGYGEEYLLKDPAGQKIRCWYNTRNRPFSLNWMKSLAQDLLHSGPLLPIESRRWQVNGEPIIFGRCGQCLSGQHRGIALIWAVFEYRKNKEYWLEHGGWESDPVLECVLTVGIDEEPRTTRTLDNVKPRTLSDVFYTSGIFDKLPRTQKEKCSNMMDAAIDFLWKRTGVGDNEALKHQTHGESVDFFDRHPKLLECVEKMYAVNSAVVKDKSDQYGMGLSDINLQPGLCTGMLYMMGSCGSDPDEYLSGVHARSEKALNWDEWDRACEFWTSLAGGAKSFEPVRQTLRSLVDPDRGTKGRNIEKIATIAKAWELYFLGEEFTEEGLKLEYYTDPDTGKMELLVGDGFPSFGGIDKGESEKTKGDFAAPPTQEEIKERKSAVKEGNRVAELDKVVKSKGQNKVETNGYIESPSDKSRDQMLRDIKESHPGKVILFLTKDGGKFWGNDAQYVAKVLNKAPDKTPDKKLDVVFVPTDKIDDVKLKLMAAKARLAVCEPRIGEDPPYAVVDIQGPSKIGAK